MDSLNNAAGVPLTLIGTPAAAGGEVSIDWSGVPAGINGKTYTSADVAAMDSAARQSLFDALIAKYAGVSIDEGHGTRVFNTEMDMTPADDALYQQMRQLGAVAPAAPATVTAGVTTPATSQATSGVTAPVTAPAPSGAPVAGAGDKPSAVTGVVVGALPHTGTRIMALVAECKKDLSIAEHAALDELSRLGQALRDHL